MQPLPQAIEDDVEFTRLGVVEEGNESEEESEKEKAANQANSAKQDWD